MMKINFEQAIYIIYGWMDEWMMDGWIAYPQEVWLQSPFWS